MPLKLHEYNETDLTGGCLAYLGKAENVAVTENLQQPHTLSFEYPMNDEKAEMIQENRIVSVEGQGYRITDVTREYCGVRYVKVKAARVFFNDAVWRHFPTIGNDTDGNKDTIGVDPYYVLRAAIDEIKKKDKDAPFEIISDSELEELGMTRIGADGVKIDFFPTDKINLYDIIQSVIDAYGRGELYVDNYKFAVVERIGKDNGVRLSLRKNLTKLSIQRDISELVTRLYPYGADDMPITPVNKGKAYIDSPNKDKYGIIEGYKDYSDYTDPKKIFDFAKWDLMGDGNEDRLDAPRLTITGDVVDLSKLAEYGDFYKIRLGDTVHVHENDAVYDKRIIGMTYYPYSAKQPTVTIGVPTLKNAYFAAWQKSKLFKAIQKNSGTNNKWKTKYFTGIVNSTQNPVRSENKQLLLDGDLLYINDRSGKRRINIGNVDGVFVFEIFNEDEKKTIEINENGNITITGVFSTGTEDEARTVINANGIQSYNAANEKHGLWSNPAYADFIMYYKNKKILELINGNPDDNNGNYSLYLGGNHVMLADDTGTKFGEGVSGSFMSADGKTVTVEGGIITKILYAI